MTDLYDDKNNDTIHQKISIIKGFLGTELDMSLTVLAYTMADVALNNDVSFRSLIKNLAMIWEHVEEGADDAND